MSRLDEWVTNNLPPAYVSYLSILGGWFAVWMLTGFSFIGFIAGMLIGPFLGWGIAIAWHQVSTAKPMREEDEKRYEERRRNHAEKKRQEAGRLQEMARLRESRSPEDRAEYKRRCQQEADERSLRVAREKVRVNAIIARGRDAHR